MTTDPVPPGEDRDARNVCPAQYEPVPLARRDTTHTCCRLKGHDPPHLCPVCRTTWTRPREVPSGGLTA